MSEDESNHTVELEEMFVIKPAHPWWHEDAWAQGKSLPEGFRYGSDSNPRKLSADELRKMIKGLEVTA